MLTESSTKTDGVLSPSESKEAIELKDLLGIHSLKEASILHAVAPLVAENKKLKAHQEYLLRDIDRIARYMDQIHYDLLAVERSYAWKAGLKLVKIARRILKRNAPAPEFEDIHRLLNTYHHWKKSRD